MLSATKIINTINQNAERIKNFGVKQIGIFGSYIKSSQTKKSDIDVLVSFNSGEKTFNNYMDLKYFLQNLFRSKVDLVLKESLKPRLKPVILKETKYAKL